MRFSSSFERYYKHVDWALSGDLECLVKKFLHPQWKGERKWIADDLF